VQRERAPTRFGRDAIGELRIRIARERGAAGAAREARHQHHHGQTRRTRARLASPGGWAREAGREPIAVRDDFIHCSNILARDVLDTRSPWRRELDRRRVGTQF